MNTTTGAGDSEDGADTAPPLQPTAFGAAGAACQGEAAGGSRHVIDASDATASDSDGGLDGVLEEDVPQALPPKARLPGDPGLARHRAVNCCKLAALLCVVVLLAAAAAMLASGASPQARGGSAASDAVGRATRDILSFGPRVVGDTAPTSGHSRTRQYLREQVAGIRGPATPPHAHPVQLFEPLQEHVFTDSTPSGEKVFRNLFTRAVAPAGSARCHLVLCAHYDSLNWASLRGFMGASDSVTSLALILSAMQALADRVPTPQELGCNVTVVFFDGEESFVRWSGLDHTYGSRRFARDWAASPQQISSSWDEGYTLGSVTTFALLDLLGTADCGVPIYYDTTLPDYNALVAQEAAYLQRMGIKGGAGPAGALFTQLRGGHLQDDHIPFLDVSCPHGCVPVLHLISFNSRTHSFPKVWHTMADNGDAIDWGVLSKLDAIISGWVVLKGTGGLSPEPAPSPAPPTPVPTPLPTPPPVPSVRQIATEILAFGPRNVPTTAVDTGGHLKAKQYLLSSMALAGGRLFEAPRVQEFTQHTLLGDRTFWNLYTRATVPRPPGGEACNVVLAAHYDTLNHGDAPQLTGAIDSASCLALILRMMRGLSDAAQAGRAVTCNVTVLMFDGEESFVHWTSSDSVYGARHFANAWQQGAVEGWGPEYALSTVTVFTLLDLLGSAGNTVPRQFKSTSEDYSALAGIEAGYLASHPELSSKQHIFGGIKWPSISDDHGPFLDATCGTQHTSPNCIPVLHLVGDPFPPAWHNNADNIAALDWEVMARLDYVLNTWIQGKALA